eukprot:scaffold6127_cov15-Tisochrysis_lutea.AAC.1
MSRATFICVLTALVSTERHLGAKTYWAQRQTPTWPSNVDEISPPSTRAKFSMPSKSACSA